MPVISFPNFNSKATNDEDYFLPVWIRFLQDIWRRIGGQRDLKLGGVIHNDISQIGSVGAGEDDLMTYTLAPNSLNTSGDFLEVVAFGTLASNGNSKTIRFRFGSQTIYATAANAANGGTWYFKGYIIRSSSSTQKIIITAHSNNVILQDDGPYSAIFTAGTQDLTTNQIIKCTGQGISNNDIVQQAMIIKYYSNT